MTKSKPPTQQRTLVIGAGQAGAATVQAFQARALERWGDIPTVACMASDSRRYGHGPCR